MLKFRAICKTKTRMKIKFKQQQYQSDAVDALCSVFLGQQPGMRKDLVARRTQKTGEGLFVKEIAVEEYAFSNKKIDLSEGTLLANIQKVQQEQGLPVSSKLESPLVVQKGTTTHTAPNLTIEMETGTGKTYVYTKAMFELNKQYGWSKFIIMVPSVAIREGVYKSLSMTAEHFHEEYGKKLRYCIYDTKNKSNLTNIKNFATTGNIEVIVMNYQAFGTKSKDGRKIFQTLDELQSEKPIDVIRRARPILIIDEPQRFGPTAEGMLKEFDPLCITRYSATHTQDFNKIYRLDAIDAYNQKLVKKIRVKGIEVRGVAGGAGYLFLDQIHVSAKAYPSATVQMELEARKSGGVRKVLKRVQEGDDLYALSGEMKQYEGYVVREINANTGTVSFTNGMTINIGQVVGSVEETHLRTIQIREAIRSHIEKERELFARGIKVLTLFFIDEVGKYRAYDEKGNKVRSEYEEIFEGEYRNATGQAELFDAEYRAYLALHPVEKVHNGYFSIDKKGRAVDSKEKRGEDGSDDVSAYDLIMKDKERLLSFDEPTRFIFSHSALREGWDNPNIFQICTLRHSQSTISKRQEIGRGLRVAVDKSGERMDAGVLEGAFFDVNTLTVIANESYDAFAKGLQGEMLDVLKGRPITLETSVFVGIALRQDTGIGETKKLSDREIRHLLTHFEEQGYIDEQSYVTQACIEDCEAERLRVPEDLEPYKKHISEIVKKVYDTRAYKVAHNGRAEDVHDTHVRPNDNFAKKEFQALWNKIRVQTVYEVAFQTPELVEKCVQALNANLSVRTVTTHITTGEQEALLESMMVREGTAMKKTAQETEKNDAVLGTTCYDLLEEVAKNTNLTRHTVATILSAIQKVVFAQYMRNPEEFIRGVTRIIEEQKATALIENIRYIKTDNTYEDDIFTINHLHGSTQEDLLAVKKHIYDYVKTDSKIERKFAEDLELGDNKVVVYAKLPRGFTIPTPVGNYNPDWAIVFDEKEVKHIYFIAETKGSMHTLQLKGIEQQKIAYAKKHFATLSEKSVGEGAEQQPIVYDVVDTYEHLMEKVMR
jgi:type III restriction enzyme